MYTVIKLLLITYLCLSSFCAHAQSLKDFYIQALHAKGKLYFVLPQKMNVAKEVKNFCAKSLSYDYTYLDSSDSVSILMTVTTNDVFKADSMIVSLSERTTMRYGVEIIYINPLKRGWESRVSCKITENDWQEMYQGEQPFKITFFSSGSSIRPAYLDKPSKWKKISSKFLKLQEMIRINR